MDQYDASKYSIDSYLEYRRIVGDDDGGTLFNDAQYKEYIERVAPLRLNNRIYVSWRNAHGIDCKLIGPETECFCSHRYKQHKTDFDFIEKDRPIKQPCRVSCCECNSFEYIPSLSKGGVRCKCKHFSYDHSKASPHSCLYDTCDCENFAAAYVCPCGEAVKQHRTLSETKKERMSGGYPVGKDTLYQAMGGLTGFSSLSDGYLRLDESGIGPPSDEVLQADITLEDHAFLRANIPSIVAYTTAKGTASNQVEVSGKQPTESDLQFYERKFQDRKQVKKASPSKGKVIHAPTARNHLSARTMDKTRMELIQIQTQQQFTPGSGRSRGGGFVVRKTPRNPSQSQGLIDKESKTYNSLDLSGLTIDGSNVLRKKGTNLR